jgi:hypothetical protein
MQRIQEERTEMLEFNRFIAKVINKLRKHLLGLTPYKGKLNC